MIYITIPSKYNDEQITKHDNENIIPKNGILENFIKCSTNENVFLFDVAFSKEHKVIEITLQKTEEIIPYPLMIS